DGGTLTCTGACALDTNGCTECGDGTADASEQCDGTDFKAATCTSLGFDGGTLACLANCATDDSACFGCGDGAINPGEVCDGSALGGATCAGQGFLCGTLSCAADCDSFVTSACTNNPANCQGCGNNTVESPEMCDGTDLQGATCQS